MDARTDEDLFMDGVEAVLQAALERIGDDPDTQFRYFRRLLAIAQEEAGGRCLS